MTAADTPAAPAPKPSVAWEDGTVVAVDQRALPHSYRQLRLTTVDGVIDAIRSLAVRGAPAIGIAGALGVALAARIHERGGVLDEAAARADAERLAGARPTAVNLAWAVHRTAERIPDGAAAVLAEAFAIAEENAGVNGAAARNAADLLESLVEPGRKLRVLTHCNTGPLATSAHGTALGAITELAARGRIEEVLVDETRPLLQGARLTAWELGEAGVPYRLCVDSAAASSMNRGLVDAVLVGADRIAANGDTANKIGTYGLAVAAARHGLPFVVVAPESSWDRTLPDGDGIVVEERAAEEVTAFGGTAVAPAEAAVYNPAFDVTPAELITAVVSERGAFRPRSTGPAPGSWTTPAQLAAVEEAQVGGRTEAPREAPPEDAEQRLERHRAATGLARFSAALYERGWMPGTSGNLSVRLPGTPELALITASGRDKGELTAADAVAVDAATAQPVGPTGGRRASAETAIHTAVYRTTDARAVIHAHSPYATLIACRHADRTAPTTLRIERFELLKGLGVADPSGIDLPVFPNWPDVPRIGEDVAALLAATPGAPPGLLIADHGITVWGEDLAQARNRLECLESICQLLALGA